MCDFCLLLNINDMYGGSTMSKMFIKATLVSLTKMYNSRLSESIFSNLQIISTPSFNCHR